MKIEVKLALWIALVFVIFALAATGCATGLK